MGYQSLLFCPDEKTARTVTQVLSELDFTVVPCTEPFAAVKKLMGERFDAIVVDCDNEQNATLLFKSARNAPNNQSSLAVAVVEGQAGVAKAFRIGANLVLTKPINVEQAKGTLRVARGLLRKSETAKSTTSAAGVAAKPTASAPIPPKPPAPATTPNLSTRRHAAPVAPLATAAIASIANEKPVAPKVGASALSVSAEAAESKEAVAAASNEVIPASMVRSAAPTSVPIIISAAAAEPKADTISSKPEVLTPSSVGFSPAGSVGLARGAASAPAPAREADPIASPVETTSTVVSEPEIPVEKVAASSSSASAEESISPAPSFTLGGTVGDGAQSASGGSKKAFLAVAAVVLIATGGYAAWTQWARLSGTSSPARAAAQPVTTTVPVPQAVPITATSAASQQHGLATTSSDTRTSASAKSAPSHQSKVSAGADSSESPASAENQVPAAKSAAQPIVIKNHRRQSDVGKSAPSADAPAPSVVAIAAPANGASLPNLASGQSSAPAPVLQVVNVSQGVSRGLLIKQAQPSYPANAMHMHVEGPVQLLATISKNGDISAVKILSGDASLARAAAEAVKQWKYKPYLLNGEPVEIQTQVTVNFKLPR
jgi:TonB family protein